MLYIKYIFCYNIFNIWVYILGYILGSFLKLSSIWHRGEHAA